MRILTFDIEEWFHILDHAPTKSEVEWQNYAPRIHRNVERILALLEGKSLKATFFCLGWIAERYPEVVRLIDAQGHELGAHSDRHQLIYEQTPGEFRADTLTSIRRLEDLTGKRVRAYRAPGFSITARTRWAFEVLRECGIELDSSVFPATRAHGGLPEEDRTVPFLMSTPAGTLREFPISTVAFFGKRMVYSGGGYFRLLPYPLLSRLVKRSPYVMTYFHPRDFDADQPLVPGLSALRHFKSYYGLQHAFPKLERLLMDFGFVDLDAANRMVNWDSPQVAGVSSVSS